MNFKILRAIFWKDVLGLAPMLGISALLFLANAVIQRWELLPELSPYLLPVLLAAMVVVILTVFQRDSPTSFTDDSLCRPIRKRELLTAKALLVLGATYLPALLGAFFADLKLGLPWAQSFWDAALLPDELPLILLPMLLFSAIITRTLIQGFGVLFGVFLAVFVLPTPFVRPPGPLDPGIGFELHFSGMRWLSTAPAEIAMFVLLAVGFWLVYWRRQLAAARVLMAITLFAAMFCFVLPMSLLSWNSTFALQKTLGPGPSAGFAGVSLRSTRQCFPATHRSELLTDPAFVAVVRSGAIKLWEEEVLHSLGNDSVAFLTQIEPRGLPPDWRVKVDYVRAEYSADGKQLYSLRPSNYLGDRAGNDRGGGGSLTHAWMLPDTAVQRLQGERPALALTYSMTVMKPREYRLPADGKSHDLPGLGYCRATPDEAYDRIDVKCFGAFAAPAQVSAELNEIPASRVYGLTDLAPAWVRWPYARRVKLAIASPRLARHDTITITGWDVAGHADGSLSLPGILGADLATCPLPSRDDAGFRQSRWRDAAPHESQQITVDAGVQLEVLDFGGKGPAIVLLPGLGATAHSFDDLAPLLARKHRVIAMTRRGIGFSSKPDFGYDTPRLAQDVLEVMKAMDIDKALLVGHSIAGDELTWLGGHHPERFEGLVYLDAAYDRSRGGESESSSRLRVLNQSLPPEPPIPESAFQDYASMLKLLQSRGHLRYPEGELIALMRVNTPFVAGTPSIDPRAQQAILAHIQAPDYARLTIPALAVYAFPDPNKPLPPWYDAENPRLRESLAEMDGIMDANKRQSIELFRRQVAHGRVLELPHATHNLILSNQAEVLAAIEEFSATLNQKPD